MNLLRERRADVLDIYFQWINSNTYFRVVEGINHADINVNYNLISSGYISQCMMRRK